MDESLARWLVGPGGAEALAEAAGWPDPSSLAAARALRRRWTPEQAAAVTRQVELRRRAVAKFGERSGELFFTSDGLEQATRAGVAAWRAGRFAAAGAERVIDLGCGIGADALAFADAGLEVVAVERDPATAVLAQANLADRGRVVTGDAVELADRLTGPGDAVFLDPARRTARGRTWRVADVSPSWEWAVGRLADRVGCLKAGPGIAHADLPEALAAAWVSDRGDLVEAGLWSGQPDWTPGSRAVVLLPDGIEWPVEQRPAPRIGAVGRYLHEPDPAVIRAGGIPALAERLDGRLLAPGIAYLTTDNLVETPLATGFEIERVLPHDERTLRGWVREAAIGALEIKVRGLDLDPAALRRRLKLAGPRSATVILTPTPDGARALIARRLRDPGAEER